LFFSLQNQNTRYKDVKAVFSSIAAVMATDVPHVSDHIDAACDTAGTPACASRRTSTQKPGRKYNAWWAMKRTPSPEWDEVIIDKLAGEIKQRHYSRKTLKAYADWSRKFQIFLKNKPPAHLSADDVKAYLTHLAVNCMVAAFTQIQAIQCMII
jgi:hypothetical protein